MKINNQNAKNFLEKNIFHIFSHRDDSKGTRDDSKGPASSQKLNYLYLHFESGDSQHESNDNLLLDTVTKTMRFTRKKP